MSPAPADSPGDVAALQRARDIDVSQSQGQRSLVYSADGYVYEAMTSLPDESMDMAPPPRRERASTMIAFDSVGAEAKRDSLLRVLDLQTSGFDDRPIYVLDNDGVMQVSEVPGLLAGIDARHPFQVVYAGDDAWHVGAGKVDNSGVITALPVTILKGKSGWIVLQITWKLAADTLNSYKPVKVELKLVDSLIPPAPPIKWAMVVSGVPHNHTTELKWTRDAVLFHAIAYVDSSFNGRPLVQQSQSLNLHFFASGFPWGFFGPRNLPL